MYRIIAGRGTGKTRSLLEYAKMNNLTIVCASPDSMRYKAQRYGLVGIDCISYGEYLNTHIGSKKKYVIDELEAYLFKDIVGYTLTNED